MAEDEASSKRVVLQIFGEELGEKLALAAGYGKRKDYRSVLEPTGAVTQCERSGHPFVPNMPCYLCGLPIPDKKLLKGSEDELYVECEHIFPVTEARWFLDLYMTTRPPSDAWTKRAIELEYDQAHRVCNQAKSNYSFIKEDPATGNPVVNKVGIQRVLKNIQIRARQHVGDYTDRALDDLMKKIADTIISRSVEIENRVQILINHITSNPNFANTNLVVLMRTALLADPNTLTSSLQEVYNQWYANTANVRDYKDRLFQAFLEETYIVYPQLRPETITTTLSIPAEYQDKITSEFVRDTLRKFFEINKTPDPTGKTLLSAVYYRIYGSILIDLINKVTDTNISYFCSLYRRMSVIQKNEPSVVVMFGEVPALPERLQARCDIVLRNLEREERTRARDMTDKDIEEQTTPEEDATYYLNDLQSRLESRFASYGMTADQARQYSRSIETAVRNAFIEAYPDGIDKAIESAADETNSTLRQVFRNDPSYADRIANLASNYVRNNRRDETKTYGGSGLGGRRPLYLNVQTLGTSHSKSNEHSRLRKRSRTRRTHRIRQSTRKSKTR